MEPMGKMRKLPSLDWLKEYGYKFSYDKQIPAYLVRTQEGKIVGTSYYGTSIFVNLNSAEGKILDALLR